MLGIVLVLRRYPRTGTALKSTSGRYRGAVRWYEQAPFTSPRTLFVYMPGHGKVPESTVATPAGRPLFACSAAHDATANGDLALPAYQQRIDVKLPNHG
jgi:hypothetical protein